MVVDNFDIVLPILVLAPASAYFYSPSMSAGTLALLSSWVFAATLVGRPLGAVIFGLLADLMGRRRTTIAAIFGFAVTTALIGLLPGYSSWGVGSIIALIALRFVDGIFLGGGYAGASPLAMESSPKQRRGFYGGLIQSGNNIAFVLVGLSTLVMLTIAPPGGPTAAYSVWGWRIPFFASTLLAVVALVHYVRNVEESEAWERTTREATRSEGPKNMLQRSNLRTLGQIFIWMSGIWLALYSIIALLPATLFLHTGLESTQVTWISIAVFGVGVAAFPALGALSQRVGRRPFAVVAGLICASAGAAAYGWLVSLDAASAITVAPVAVLAGLLVLAPASIATVYITERFSTEARGLGFGMGYTLAIILPSFYATYQEWLAHLMPFEYTVIPLVVVGGVLQCIGALMGPETRDRDMSADAA